MNLLGMTQRLYRETGRAGQPPSSIVGATTDELRLFDRVIDAFLSIQNEPRNWAWMRRSAEFEVTLIGGTSYDGTGVGLADFGRWRREDKARAYRPRAYLQSNPTSAWELRWLPYDEFVRRVLDVSAAAGPPQYWSISPDEQFMVGPTPDQSYWIKADYTIEPQILAADTDIPLMPARHHMTIVWRALVDAGKFDAAPEIVSLAADKLDESYESLLLHQSESIEIHAIPMA